MYVQRQLNSSKDQEIFHHPWKSWTTLNFIGFVALLPSVEEQLQRSYSPPADQ